MAVTLSDHEQAMLAGEHGPAKAKAIRFILDYAEALGAERLVGISKAQLFVGAHHYLRTVESDDIDQVISELYLNTSERVVLDGMSCFAQTDVGPLDPDNWQSTGIAPEQFDKDRAYRRRLAKAGAAEGGSCAAYLVGFVPLMGEHYVSTESHALLFMNSVWGARANADSIEASICAAVCGRTAYWGNHIAGNRLGTYLFEIDVDLQSVWDWDLLGYVIGSLTPSNEIPVLTGSFVAPQVEHLKSCFAAMATSGSAEMCHIVGLTPEAPTFDAAFGGRTPKARFRIGAEDLAAAATSLNRHEARSVQYISLGCPHYSLKQIQEVADFLDGKLIDDRVTLHVWTAPATRDNARRSGFVQKIEQAGARVLASTCPLVSQSFPAVEAMAFDSVKQGKYMSSCTPARVFVGPLMTCLDAAIAGEWSGAAGW